MAKRYRVLVILLALILVLAAFVWLPARVHFRVTETYTFTGEEGSPWSLAVLLPRSGPYQKVEDIEVQGAQDRVSLEHSHLEELRLTGVLPQEGTQEVEISYVADIKRGRARWQGSVEEADLQAEEGIEVGHPMFVERVDTLIEGQSRDDVYSIFTFTSDHISWPEGDRINHESSALTAYKEGEGVCDEFAKLMVALCRTGGIPARHISGLTFPGQATLFPPYLYRSTASPWGHPAVGHAWVEVYTGERWEMADPSWANMIPQLHFGRNDGLHLSFGSWQERQEIFTETQAWAQERGDLLGAMTAPLFFAASSPDPLTFSPQASIQKGWDGRWFRALALLIILLVSVGRLREAQKREEE